MTLVEKVISQVRPRYTLTPEASLERTISLALEMIDSEVPGDFVECGVWMGACSFAMLLAQREAYGEIKRPVWMYDSFEGMSPPVQQDLADAWWATASRLPKNQVSNEYCICPIEHVEAAITELDLWDGVKIVPGWLADTLPLTKPDQIALLRIDCDWYEPVTCCLEELGPRVSSGGGIILDDYDAWEGCRAATHGYLAKHGLPWVLNPIGDRNGAWMVKS